MDTQFAFASREEIWRLHEDMKHVYSVQAEHADRLIRLERRQEDDARMKSVWSTSSPFPSVLSGTPQPGPIHPPPAAGLPNLDQGHQLNLLGNLHLDSEEEPKRGASRANSVRFDESAIQGHWSQGSVPLRTGSGFGGHPIERSTSHKSDGRQSSAAQSVHSAYSTHSTRGNSLALDTSFLGRGQSGGSPLEASGPSPGMALLGPVPSIIRCWLNTNFSHETLIYAAICTGSYESYLSHRLVRQLGFRDRVQKNEHDKNRINLPVYLPEAVVKQPSSRSSSPAPQLPALTVEFTVVTQPGISQQKHIEVFIGSDALRAYNADILFSSNSMTLLGVNHEKFSVPLVRPEEQTLFKTLYTAAMVAGEGIQNSANSTNTSRAKVQDGRDIEVAIQGMAEVGKKLLSGVRAGGGISEQGQSEQQTSSHHSQFSAPNDGVSGASRGSNSLDHTLKPAVNTQLEPFMKDVNHVMRADDVVMTKQKLSNDRENQRDAKSTHEDQVENAPARESSSGVWGPWRREPPAQKPADTSNGHATPGKGHPTPARSRGTKVLRPSKSSISSSFARAAFPTSQPTMIGFDNGVSSRPTDQGAKNDGINSPHQKESRKSISNDTNTSSMATRERSATSASQPRSANPIGGASAFAWLNGGGQQKSAGGNGGAS